ncbi:MAG: c-type cytochrome domain-containing protein [Planctomycetota bacterium]
MRGKRRQFVVIAGLLTAIASSHSYGTPVDFEKEIAPILASSCVRCHGPEKKKGKLRLDRKADALKVDADADYFVVAPGKPEASELMRRIELPPDDDEVMPGEGEHLSAAQIALIREWIKAGAAWPDGFEIRDAKARPEDGADIKLPALSAEENARQEQIIATLRARGVHAARIAQDTPAVDVNFALKAGEITDQDLALLDGLEPTLVWLNLARTAITDAGVARLARFRELRRLALDGTKITDAALAGLTPLGRLAVLNLHSTAIGDAGLKHLAKLAPLKRLYLWRTQVTEAGVRELKAGLPTLEVELGKHADPPPPPAEKPKPADLALPTCCATAKAAGKTCEHPCCVEATAQGKTCERCAKP